MNVFTKFGFWFEKHFPEKLTAEDVNRMFTMHQTLIDSHQHWIAETNNLLKSIENSIKDLPQLKAELSAIKAQTTIKTRITGSLPDTMTPFASRMKPAEVNQ